MNRRKGWILIEYSIILAVMGILFVTISIGYSKYKENTDRNVAIEGLSQLKNQINNFAAMHGRLPNATKYTTTNLDAEYGIEFMNLTGQTLCPGGDCINGKVMFGILPNKTLGIQKSNLYKDKKGNEISYIVNFNLTNSSQFSQNSFASDIEIKDEKGNVILDKNTMGGVAYVLVWHSGKKYDPLFNSKTQKYNIQCPAVTSTDNIGENCNFFSRSNDLTFIHRTKIDSPDFIVWESHANLQSAFLRNQN